MRYGNAVHLNGFEFKRSRSVTDLAQKSLGLNILKSETNRLTTVTYSNLPITKTDIKDGFPYLLHSFGIKYFNKISLGNMLYFQNKL